AAGITLSHPSIPFAVRAVPRERFPVATVAAVVRRFRAAGGGTPCFRPSKPSTSVVFAGICGRFWWTVFLAIARTVRKTVHPKRPFFSVQTTVGGLSGRFGRFCARQTIGAQMNYFLDFDPAQRAADGIPLSDLVPGGQQTGLPTPLPQV